MKKKDSNYLIGGILILLGIIMGGRALDIWHFTIFFDGWWTLFLIIPGVIGFVGNKKERSSYIAPIVIGVLLLLWRQDVIYFSMVFPLGIAFTLVYIGFRIIFPRKVSYDQSGDGSYTTYYSKTSTDSNSQSTSSTQNPRHSGKVNYTAILSGRELRFDNEVFDGANLTCVLGGIDLDLRNAIIRENVVIDAKAVLGGIDIYVPDYVRVVVSGNPILGGVDNKTDSAGRTVEQTVTIQLNATCVLCGIDVK